MCAVQCGFCKVGPQQNSIFQLCARQVGTRQHSVSQICSGQIRICQIRICQIGIHQIDALHIGTAKIRVLGHDALHVSPFQLRVVERGVAEIDIAHREASHIHATQILLAVEKLHDVDDVETLVGRPTELNEFRKLVPLCFLLKPLELRHAVNCGKYASGQKGQDMLKVGGITIHEERSVFWMFVCVVRHGRCDDTFWVPSAEALDVRAKHRATNIQNNPTISLFPHNFLDASDTCFHHLLALRKCLQTRALLLAFPLALVANLLRSRLGGRDDLFPCR